MKVAVIGAGNVATHLVKALSGIAEIYQIAARTETSASQLAELVNAGDNAGVRCEVLTDLSTLRGDMDLYLIAVNDDAVADVVAATHDFPGIWAHTSGSVGMDVFRHYKSRYGVFYPLQTFSKGVDVRFNNIPLLIEGCDPETTARLESIAHKITETVRLTDSATREDIHVAAVFACNFANLMWAEADRLLNEQGMDISFMLPLLQATLDKLLVKSPADAMTGPARRGDMAVINKHLTSLPHDLKPVYALLSDRIISMFRKNTDE